MRKSSIHSLLFATIILSALSISLAAAVLPGQWTVATTVTARPRCFLTTPTAFWVGTDNGIWVTTDNGATWTGNNSGITSLSIKGLAAVGSDVFVGTYGGGVYWLNNTTWTSVNKGLAETAQITSLAVSGTDLIAAGTLIYNDNHHVFKTSDKGTTWKTLGANSGDRAIAPPGEISQIAIKNSTFILATSAGLYRSTDSGTNFVRLPGFQQLGTGCAYSTDLSTLYASGVGQDQSSFGVSVSTDDGTTWRAMSYGLDGAGLLAVNGTNVYAGLTLNAGLAYAPTTPVTAASVSGANFTQVYGHSAGSIASIFGSNLATTTQPASFVPLPTVLGGSTVTILDSSGTTFQAPLFYVSPGQINYQVPTGIANGWFHITITSGNSTVSYATAKAYTASFALFTADSTGIGAPAAYVQRVSPGGAQQILPVAQFDSVTNKWVPTPIDVSSTTDKVYLVLFGTGIRNWDSATYPVFAYVSPDGLTSIPLQAVYAGPQGTFVGVDQVNILLPSALAGAGNLTAYITAFNGPYSNSVNIRIQ